MCGALLMDPGCVAMGLNDRHDDHREKVTHSSADSQGRVRVDGEDVSPMYDGLRTNLPHVSVIVRILLRGGCPQC